MIPLSFLLIWVRLPVPASSPKLDMPLAIIDKRRPKANVSEVMNIIGNVEGKKCILVDDLIATAGTLVHAADALVERGGATEVYACATHGVLSGPALERIQNSPIKGADHPRYHPADQRQEAG